MFDLVGPRPDLDPDIVAALDDALDLDDPENILEDDFFVKVVYIFISNSLHAGSSSKLFEEVSSVALGQNQGITFDWMP